MAAMAKWNSALVRKAARPVAGQNQGRKAGRNTHTLGAVVSASWSLPAVQAVLLRGVSRRMRRVNLGAERSQEVEAAGAAGAGTADPECIQHDDLRRYDLRSDLCEEQGIPRNGFGYFRIYIHVLLDGFLTQALAKSWISVP